MAGFVVHLKGAERRESAQPRHRETGPPIPKAVVCRRPGSPESSIASLDALTIALAACRLIRHLRVGLHFLAELHPGLGTVAVDL
jgi:hypothetical protein